MGKKAEENKPVETIAKPLFETSPVPSSTPKNLLEKGQISITVYKARNIEKKGMFGKADPYVKIMLDTQKATSATVKDNHNPEWNFTTKFDIDKNTTQKMTIAVFDEDLGKDDSLGSTSLDIGVVQTNIKLLNQWVPLENCKSGEILLSAEFIPSSMVEQQKTSAQGNAVDKIKETGHVVDMVPKQRIEEDKPQSKISKPDVQATQLSIKTSEVPVEAGQLIISVHKAKDIEKKGMFGKADPYVKLTLGKQTTKSETVKNNYNPEWDFKAIFYVDHNTSDKVTIEVFDDDFGKDDSLGNASLDIITVQKNKKLLNQWIPLKECKSGQILLSAEFIPAAIVKEQGKVNKTEPTKESLQEMEESKQPEEISKQIDAKTPVKMAK